MICCILSNLVLFVLLAHRVSALSNPTLLAEWVVLDYDFNSEYLRATMLNDRRFVPENNIITGVKMFDAELYVSVPRWLSGVPATLSQVDTHSMLLRPFPDWHSQAQLPDFSFEHIDPLVYVQSFEIDSRGWMWILDCGQLNFLESANTPGVVRQAYATNLRVYDLTTKCWVHRYAFDDSIFGYSYPGASFANDLVVDEKNGRVYITDTTIVGGSQDTISLVVYDSISRLSRRYEHSRSMSGMPRDVWIDGFLAHFNLGTDGISLSHDGATLFYSSVSLNELWSVPTALLANFSSTKLDFSNNVYLALADKGLSDGLASDDQQRMFFGNASACALGVRNITGETTQLLADTRLYNWIDTFGFDKRNAALLFTSNRLPLFFARKLNFSLGAGSYLAGHPNPLSAPCLVTDPIAGPSVAWYIYVAVTLVVAMIVIVASICYWRGGGSIGARRESEMLLVK